MSKIFLSYAQKEESVNISLLEEALSRNGYEVDRDIGFLEYGDHQKPIIKRKIQEADYVLLILSPYSITRPWVIRELYEALLQEQVRQKKILIPYVVGGLNHEDLMSNPALTQWTRTDPFYIKRAPDCHQFEELVQALKSVGNRYFKQNYSILPMIEDDLRIYRTSERVNFGKNENLKYAQTVDSYFLFGYEKGVLFKHFILCEVKDMERIKDIIGRYNFLHLSGAGSADIQGKWRVWFLDTNFELTSDINDPYCNNIERQTD